MSRAPGDGRGPVRVVSRAVGCRANAHPKTSRIWRATTSASCGAGDDDDQAEQGRAEHEGRLVGGALVGERGLHQVRLVVLLLAGDRAPAHPGQRADLRHGGTRDARPWRRRARGRPRPGRARRGQQAEPAEQRLHQHHGSLTDAVGEAAGDRGADGIRDGQRTGRGTAGAVRAGRAGDEQEGAHLGHRQRQAADERDGDVEGTGEAEQPPVGGEGGHRGLPGLRPGRAERACAEPASNDAPGPCAPPILPARPGCPDLARRTHGSRIAPSARTALKSHEVTTDSLRITHLGGPRTAPRGWVIRNKSGSGGAAGDLGRLADAGPRDRARDQRDEHARRRAGRATG